MWWQVRVAVAFASGSLCPALWQVHGVPHAHIRSFLTPLRPLQMLLLQAKLPQVPHPLFPNHSSSMGPPKSMLPHLTNDVPLTIDLPELAAPDFLSTAKGVEIECTVREKQINYSK